jgi:hypothetical protein
LPSQWKWSEPVRDGKENVTEVRLSALTATGVDAALAFAVQEFQTVNPVPPANVTVTDVAADSPEIAPPLFVPTSVPADAVGDVADVEWIVPNRCVSKIVAWLPSAALFDCAT